VLRLLAWVVSYRNSAARCACLSVATRRGCARRSPPVSLLDAQMMTAAMPQMTPRIRLPGWSSNQVMGPLKKKAPGVRRGQGP
jgi:hypothetical protein